MSSTLPDPAVEHARAMRIVSAVLAACDPRAATANAARKHGLTAADGRWVLAIGKAAIGMAEGLADHCGIPDRHLIVTIDGPNSDRLNSIVRSDHPLPTQRSFDAGQAVKHFIEEAKAMGENAPAITALISGGASALICEPIPGVELAHYRAIVEAMLTAGWDIQQTNAVRRAIDALKGGALAALAAPLPIDLIVISDVIGNTLHDIGSGPFVQSPTDAEDARRFLSGTLDATPGCDEIFNALSCLPRGDAPPAPRRAIVALDNSAAVTAAAAAVASEGFTIVSERTELTSPADTVALSALQAVRELGPRDACVWGGEWPIVGTTVDTGGRCQFVAAELIREFSTNDAHVYLLALATDGADGVAPQGKQTPAGAFLCSGMSWTPVWVLNGPKVEGADEWYEHAYAENDEMPLMWWGEANSYHVIAHRDKHRRDGEPPSHIFTGPTGTNVNDILVVWRA